MLVLHKLPLLSLLVLFTVIGCASPGDVPKEFEEKLDREATFTKILKSPNAYKGSLVMLTGMVLNMDLPPEFTRIELLQLPLDSDGVPVADLNASQGRFLVTCPQMIDPATFPQGTRISVIGEVIGTSRIKGREIPYITLRSKAINVWPSPQMQILKDPKTLWSLCGPTF